MVTNSQFIALLLIAGLLGIVVYTTHQVQVYGYGGGSGGYSGYAYIQPVTAYDCTAPNPPPSCYNS
jgi:hypothetical protein